MTRNLALLMAASTIFVAAQAAVADTQNGAATGAQWSPNALSFPAITQTAQPAAATLINGNSANFQQTVMQSPVPVLLEFYATWCPHCQHMTPTLQSLAQQYAGKIKVVRVDIDQNPQLADKFGVSGVPHFFVLKKGQVVDSITGEASLSRLNASLSRSFM